MNKVGNWNLSNIKVHKKGLAGIANGPIYFPSNLKASFLMLIMNVFVWLKNLLLKKKYKYELNFGLQSFLSKFSDILSIKLIVNWDFRNQIKSLKKNLIR